MYVGPGSLWGEGSTLGPGSAMGVGSTMLDQGVCDVVEGSTYNRTREFSGCKTLVPLVNGDWLAGLLWVIKQLVP